MTKQEKREAILRELETMPDGFGVILVDLEGLNPEQLRTVQTIDNLYKRGTAPYWAGFALNSFGRPLMQELSRVIDEMHHQDAKFGPARDLNGLEWIGILTEEVGEAAKNCVDAHWSHDDPGDDIGAAVVELIQVAAVAIQAAASLRRQYSKGPVRGKPLFCQCVDPAPEKDESRGVEICENCGGVTKDFGNV